MRRRKRIVDTQAPLFKRLYGVKPDAFEKMVSILQKKYDALHQKGGKPPKLTIEDKLYITLKYLREYRTMDSKRRNTVSARVRSTCPSNGRKTH